MELPKILPQREILRRQKLEQKKKFARIFERDYICSYDGCGKVFKVEKCLKNHERIHTGKYKCSFTGCKRSFVS